MSAHMRTPCSLSGQGLDLRRYLLSVPSQRHAYQVPGSVLQFLHQCRHEPSVRPTSLNRRATRLLTQRPGVRNSGDRALQRQTPAARFQTLRVQFRVGVIKDQFLLCWVLPLERLPRVSICLFGMLSAGCLTLGYPPTFDRLLWVLRSFGMIS